MVVRGFVFILFVAIPASLARAQATVPASRPVPPLRSIEEIIGSIPREDQPKDGRWTELHGTLCTKWAQEKYAGRTVELKLYYSGATPKKDATSARALFFYAIRTDELKNDWPTTIVKLNVRWETAVEGIFDTEGVKKLAQLKEWQNHQRGDRVLIRGRIKTIKIIPTHNSGSEAAISLNLDDCVIEK